MTVTARLAVAMAPFAHLALIADGSFCGIIIASGFVLADADHRSVTFITEAPVDFITSSPKILFFVSRESLFLEFLVNVIPNFFESASVIVWSILTRFLGFAPKYTHGSFLSRG